MFLDTEFNGFGGELISIALVSDKGGKDAEFYGVRHLPDDIVPWASQHVVPVLDQSPEDDDVLKRRLREFLHGHAGEPIVADWPLDFIHFLVLLCEPGGRAYQFALTMQLIKQGAIESSLPHNALADATALMRAYTGTGGARD